MTKLNPNGVMRVHRLDPPVVTFNALGSDMRSNEIQGGTQREQVPYAEPARAVVAWPSLGAIPVDDARMFAAGILHVCDEIEKRHKAWMEARA